jgi:hypothetical protein
MAAICYFISLPQRRLWAKSIVLDLVTGWAAEGMGMAADRDKA